MSYVPQNITFYVSSNPANGARNLSSDGSEFEIQLNSPLHIPRDAKSVILSVPQSSIWNNSFNISVDIGNNNFTYYQAGTPKPHTIPDGQYSLASLNSAIQRFLADDGYSIDSIEFLGDVATNKLILSVATGFRVDFSVANAPAEILGFDPLMTPALIPDAPTLVYAPYIAQFNRINSYLIKSNITNYGIPINANYNGLIAQVPISAPPGSLIVYAPNNPSKVAADDLVSFSKNSIQFQLLDDQQRRVDTNDEYWDFILSIDYLIPA